MIPATTVCGSPSRSTKRPTVNSSGAVHLAGLARRFPRIAPLTEDGAQKRDQHHDREGVEGRVGHTRQGRQHQRPPVRAQIGEGPSAIRPRSVPGGPWRRPPPRSGGNAPGPGAPGRPHRCHGARKRSQRPRTQHPDGNDHLLRRNPPVQERIAVAPLVLAQLGGVHEEVVVERDQAVRPSGTPRGGAGTRNSSARRRSADPAPVCCFRTCSAGWPSRRAARRWWRADGNGWIRGPW